MFQEYFICLNHMQTKSAAWDTSTEITKADIKKRKKKKEEKKLGQSAMPMS